MWHSQLFVYFQHFVCKTQMRYFAASDAETAQSKDVGNDNLECLTWLADCILSTVYKTLMGHLEAPYAKSTQCKDI